MQALDLESAISERGQQLFADIRDEAPSLFNKARWTGTVLDWANATRFALTGGVFSRSPRRLDRARREFRVGNLYLNRGITGALVGRQPFGGSRMSGGGTKAGGPDYLLHFLDPRVVTENTLRRGFTPEAIA